MGIAGLVLAAGSSTRMGRNKLLLDIRGEPLVRRTVRAALDAGLAPVLVVLGHERERISASLEGLACQAVFNADHTDGVHTSLRRGIRAVPREAEAAILTLADMPFV